MTHAPKPEPLLPEDFQQALHHIESASARLGGAKIITTYPDDAAGNYAYTCGKFMGVMIEALRRCAHPKPPSDGAAAYAEVIKTALASDVAALPDGGMSAEEWYCKTLFVQRLSQAKEGWVLVPRVATAKMIRATTERMWSSDLRRAAEAWRLMIAAAPQAGDKTNV